MRDVHPRRLPAAVRNDAISESISHRTVQTLTQSGPLGRGDRDGLTGVASCGGEIPSSNTQPRARQAGPLPRPHATPTALERGRAEEGAADRKDAIMTRFVSHHSQIAAPGTPAFVSGAGNDSCPPNPYAVRAGRRS